MISLYIANTIKALRLLATNKSIGPASSFYDPKYPPWKHLMPSNKWIHVNCIMCGFPRTGTHWIRNVIEKSCNIKTGDLFENKPGYEDKHVVLIKIHARSKRIALAKAIWLLPPFKFDNKFIYVFRDPRDAIISLYEMYKKKKNVDHMNPKMFLEIYDPIAQYKWEIREWIIRRPKNVFPLKFEELKKNPKNNFKNIFNYLNLKNSIDQQSIGSLVASYDNKKRPRGIAYAWKIAPSEYQLLIEEANKRLIKEIDILGYER